MIAVIRDVNDPASVEGFTKLAGLVGEEGRKIMEVLRDLEESTRVVEQRAAQALGLDEGPGGRG